MKSAVFLALGLGLSACGGDVAEEKKQKPEKNPFTLVGISYQSFRGKCTNQSGGISEQESFNFYDSSFEKVLTQYSGNCETPLKQTELRYKFTEATMVDARDLKGWKDVSFSVLQVSTTPFTQRAVDQFNLLSAYGYLGWVINGSKEVNGKAMTSSHEPVLQAGDILKMTLKLLGDNLVLAKYEGAVATEESPYMYTRSSL